MRLRLASLVFAVSIAAAVAPPHSITGQSEVAAAPDGGTSCVGLDWPVYGPLAAPYAPIGRFAGHWGIDIAAEPGTNVRAAAAGTVPFSGSVAGNQAVTIDHGGGMKTSYSYLGTRIARRGAQVSRGTVIGTSGQAHGTDTLHFSVRRNGVYQDPIRFLGCLARGPGGALRLVAALADATA